MEFTIVPRKISKCLVRIVLGLAFLSLVVRLTGNLTGHGRLMGFGTMLSVGAEMSIPTWYSSFTLLLCSVVLGVIAAARKAANGSYALHWALLAVAFLYLSIDEACAIHETAGGVLIRALGSSPIVYFGWVIPGAICALIFGASYVGFLAHLPRRTRWLFTIAAIVYLAGALGMEALGGGWRTIHGENNVVYTLMSASEEVLEMLGVIIFIHALVSYLGLYVGDVHIRVGNAELIRSLQEPVNAVEA